jgi:hypothetical protein
MRDIAVNSRIVGWSQVKSFVRVRSAGTLSWLGFDRKQADHLCQGSIVESRYWMVLHRPVELAALIRHLDYSASLRRMERPVAAQVIVTYLQGLFRVIRVLQTRAEVERQIETLLTGLGL